MNQADIEFSQLFRQLFSGDFSSLALQYFRLFDECTNPVGLPAFMTGFTHTLHNLITAISANGNSFYWAAAQNDRDLAYIEPRYLWGVPLAYWDR